MHTFRCCTRVHRYPGTDPAWGMAFTVMAHKMLAFFGDLDAVRNQYSRLKLYIHYLARIPGVDPKVPPFVESGLLTYNVYVRMILPIKGSSVLFCFVLEKLFLSSFFFKKNQNKENKDIQSCRVFQSVVLMCTMTHTGSKVRRLGQAWRQYC